MDFSKKFGKHVLEEFTFESGTVLKDVEVEYTTLGNPKYDSDGNIINAIVFCPNMGGTQDLFQDIIPNSGFSLKHKDLFYIVIKALGTPDSCSPSTTGLKLNFPEYTFKDRVNFKRAFIHEKFNITKVLGVTGEGVGGYDVFTWACEYPDEMDFIIVLNSSYATTGHKYVISKSLESIINSSDDFASDVYSSSLNKLIVSINKLLFSYYFSENIFANLSNDEIDVMMEEYVDDGLFLDIYDFKIRNDCVLKYDLRDKLCNIKAKSLFINSGDNPSFTPKYDILPLKELVKDSEVFILKSRNSIYNDDDYSELTEKLAEFSLPFIKKMLEASID